MKKFALIALIAITGSSFIFTSCSKKKDWTCKCTVTISGMSTGGSSPIMDQKKKDAEAACDALEATSNSTFGAGTSTCDLTEN